MGAALRRRLCAAVVSRQHLYNVCFVASRHAAASRLILRQSRHWVVMFVIFRATHVCYIPGHTPRVGV